MSLRFKLALALVLLTTAATLAIGTWSYVGTSDRLYAEIDRSLVDGSANTDRNGPDPDHDGPPAPAIGQEGVLWQLLATDGHVLIPSNGVALPVDDIDRDIAAEPRPEGTPSSTRRDVDIDGHPYRLLTVAQTNGRGAVQTARSLAETVRVLDSLRNFIIEAAVLVILCAALAGWLIATKVTWRIVRLTATAEEVADTGRLDVEVPVKGRDEAGRLGTAFNDMLRALRRSRDSQQRLVQDAGHELRTPLTSLRTNIAVLRRHDDLPVETRARVLDDLDLETRELTDLVNELVALATDQRADEPPQTVDLPSLVERVSERARRRSGRSIVVRVDGVADGITSAGPIVTGRPAGLERAVSNLLDNATKFDSTDGDIDVDVAIDAGRASVTVADHGPGIDPADLPHVFDRFFRSVDARSRPGSGLGLAIVADVAREHGGEPSATNRDGGGACVGFEIPVGGADGQVEATRS